MKKRIKLVIILLIFFICISPISFSSFFDYSQAANFEEISSDQEWSTDRLIDRNIVIKTGVTITIKKGVVLTFNNGNISVGGSMLVEGTSKNPVVFKKAANTFYNYSIKVTNGGSLMMRNVDISGAGTGFSWVQNNSIMNTAYAYSYQGGIQMEGGSLNAQGCNFHDNNIAIYIRSGTESVVVNRSKFLKSSSMDIMNTSSLSGSAVDFRYNWWGSLDGPPQICNAGRSCFYEKIEGVIDSSNWLKKESFRDPVVIIPGVFGSQKEDGVWKIDPIFHVYDNLIDAFKNDGYVVGKDLFIFPYEWRDSNVENAIKLRYKISEIKTLTNWPKVDVVAHSMGGLLTREYIESNSYQKDIDQLITIGTPNNGSPEIYPLWEAGKSIGAVQAGMKKFLEQEMEEAGYDSMFEYIRNHPIFSAQELLPNYEYLYDADKKQPLIYPASYPVNTFLDNLNDKIKIKKLANVEYTKIIGNVDSDKSTISGFNVVDVDMGNIWEHGYPLSFEIPILSDRGAIDGYGDGTVPLSSAKSIDIPSDNYLELNSSHTSLPTEAQKDVLEILTGTRPTLEVTDSLIKNMLQVFVHSPIDIQVVSPSGKRVGGDFEHDGKMLNEIDGAFYTGNETENEFVTIPNPEDGEYKILTLGTGDGEYKVEATKISEDKASENKTIESTAIMTGTASINSLGELNVEVKNDVVFDKNKKDPPADDDLVVVVDPPVKPPVVVPNVIFTPSAPIFQNVQQQVSKKKSSKGHSKKKKSKKKKSSNKGKVSIAVVNQMRQVLGISASKNATKATVVSKLQNYVSAGPTTFWNKMSRAASELRNFVFNHLKNFKYFRR